MRWFYILTAGLVVGLGLAPWYLIKPIDTSMLKGKSAIYDTYPSKVRTLDPATSGDEMSGTIQAYCFESLYAYHYLKRPVGGDWSTCIVPQLAQDMPEITDGGKTWTMKLKQGVKYHRNPCFGVETDASGRPIMEADGKTPRYKTREMVADDFVLAFKRIADYHIDTELSLAFIEDKVIGIKEYRSRTQGYPKGDFSRYEHEQIEGIKALDRYTLQIRLNAQCPRLQFILAIANYAPIPHEVVDYWLSTQAAGNGRAPLDIDRRDPVLRDFRGMVGTGAFYVYDFVDAGRIVMLRNPDYRDVRYPSEGAPGDEEAGLLKDAGKRVPFVDAVYLDYVPELNPMWLLFMTRQTDGTSIPQDVYTQVVTPGKDLVDNFAKKGIRLVKYERTSVYFMTFNMKDKVVGASKSLRQAMNLGFDAETYIEVMFNGRAHRAVNILPRSIEGHDQAGPSPYARYDVEAAKAKLRQARQELVDAGVIGPGDDIPPLRIDFGGTDEETRRHAEFIKQQYAAIGLKIETDTVDWPTLLGRMNRGQCQIYSSGWGADYPDPENFLQLFYSPNVDRGTNNSNYSDPQFDKWYGEADRMPPSPERTELYVKMIRKLSEDCPFVLQYEPIYFVLAQPWLQNVKPHPISVGYTKYRRLDEAMRRKAGGR